MLLGPPKRLLELLENMPPAMFRDLSGIGMRSCGRDLRGFLGSGWLNSDIPIDVSVLLFIGIEDMSSETWPCKLPPMVGTIPWFTLLFSSASASQKALWVMKLSLLHKGETLRLRNSS